MINHERKIAVIGLGYVGLFTATNFAHAYKVIAFDINPIRIEQIKSGFDSNEEVETKILKDKNLYFTNDVTDLKQADFYIIAVPTPLDEHKNPDLSLILKASEMIALQLKKGDIVVYESSLYPGATDEQCIPVLEKYSKMTCGKDFFVGFSPERINPGDKVHTFDSIPKIVAGVNEYTLNILDAVYSKIVKAGVFRVSNIRTAEAIKIIENIQRDINIAYMNEIAMILHTLNIDTTEVIEGMKTKWNYIPFTPGLVGGHCIGVNTYYLLYKSEQLGYHSSFISAARLVNENVIKFIVDQTIKNMTQLNIDIGKARIAILGLTYKENCADLRDSKVNELIELYKSYGMTIFLHDPLVTSTDVKNKYELELTPWEKLTNLDAMVITVAHKQYVGLDKNELIMKMNKPSLIMDIKEILNPKDFIGTDITLWQL